jgi:nucleotide-binding universal stress UspA family protein
VPLNPFRSEAEAYRFVWLTIGYFGLIVAGALINRWLGLAVFIVLSAIVLFLYFRRGERRPRVVAPPRRGAEDERRILVIANETVGGETLRTTIRDRSAGSRAQILVVSPALNSPLKHWVSDEDEARTAAQARLDRSLARLREAGIEARGEIGDGEPLQAIEDALRTFGADEIIISTHPEGRSNWLEKGVVSGARERFAVPITHVVVDLERESPARAPREP